MQSGITDDSRVLITGGVGFIGSALARRLVAMGVRVTLIDNLLPQFGGNRMNVVDFVDRVQLRLGDVRDFSLMCELVRDQDVIFNLAGQSSHLDSMEDPFEDLDINARAQLCVLEACRRHNPHVRIVYAGTRQIYGKPQCLPVSEAHPIAPVDANGVSKTAGEWYHKLYHDVHGLRSCMLRLTNTYGPSMRIKDARQTFLGIWIHNVLQGRRIQIYGDGSQLRDFTYVDDVVDALIAAAAPGAMGRVFNLGGDEVMSLKEVADRLCALRRGAAAECVPFPVARKMIDIGDYYADYGAIREALGWSPKVTLNEGLQRTLRYFEKHLEAYL